MSLTITSRGPLRPATVLLAAVVVGMSCSTTGSVPDTDAQIDRIVVLYGPSGSINAGDVERRELTDAASVDRWVRTLEAIPTELERGPRMVKFRGNPPEHRLEFYAGDELRVVRRMKSGLLDTEVRPGWSFYSGEDDAFAKLVVGLVPGS